MENQNTPTPSGTSPGAASAGSGQPSPVRLVYGSLSCVPTCDLIAELYRRQIGHGDYMGAESGSDMVSTGELEPCVVLALTPSDLSEYWECDDAGNTHPGSRIPEPEEWRAIVRAFERWSFSDLMHDLRDAWNDAKEKGGSK